MATHDHAPGEGHDHSSPASHDHGHEHQQPEAKHAHGAMGHDHGDHGHEHSGHDHGEGKKGIAGWIAKLSLLHGHSHTASSDAVLESNEKGIRAVKQSLVLLAATALFQIVIVAISGSVALFADTIHNVTDAMTALPLWLAFVLARRPASRRFTYGHGRAEDLAGVFIVLIILFSALVAGYESYRRILDPTPLRNIEWVIAAAIIGFIGNEAVAILRTRVGREIGSAALVADGQHARVDGLTSLAVLFGALGVLAGAPIADPLVGALITVAILFITKDAAITIYHRLMDGIDPALFGAVENTTLEAVASGEGARSFNDLRVRWVGHKLMVEMNLVVDEGLSLREGHALAEHVRHALYHEFPHLAAVHVHVDPEGLDGEHHSTTAHHDPGSPGLTHQPH